MGQIFSADPTAIATTWQAITEGFVPGGDNPPEGVEVPAGGQAILGPYEWTPTAEDAMFGGHRCLLASVNAPNDRTMVCRA